MLVGHYLLSYTQTNWVIDNTILKQFHELPTLAGKNKINNFPHLEPIDSTTVDK